MFVCIVADVCTSSGGQLLTLQELWSVVSNSAKLDVTSVDLWKVVTQQVCATVVLIEYDMADWQ